MGGRLHSDGRTENLDIEADSNIERVLKDYVSVIASGTGCPFVATLPTGSERHGGLDTSE